MQEIDAGCESVSFCKTIDLILSSKDVKDDDIVYLLEDDYLHRPGWPLVMREAFASFGVDYVTLYDHADKYMHDVYPNLATQLLATRACHWRTTPSTTNTYSLYFKTLREHRDDHLAFSDIEKYGRITADHDKFMAMMAKGRVLISSVPGFSTHVESNLMSPTVNWEYLHRGVSTSASAK